MKEQQYHVVHAATTQKSRRDSSGEQGGIGIIEKSLGRGSDPLSVVPCWEERQHANLTDTAVHNNITDSPQLHTEYFVIRIS